MTRRRSRPFRYDRRFALDVEPEALWSLLEQTDAYVEWWSWLESLDGGGLRVGDVATCVVRAPLPYSLRFSVHIDEVVPADADRHPRRRRPGRPGPAGDRAHGHRLRRAAGLVARAARSRPASARDADPPRDAMGARPGRRRRALGVPPACRRRSRAAVTVRRRRSRDGAIRVATFNIRHGATVDDLVRPVALARACAELDPDVLGLQEVERGNRRSWYVDQGRFVAALPPGALRARTGSATQPLAHVRQRSGGARTHPRRHGGRPATRTPSARRAARCSPWSPSVRCASRSRSRTSSTARRASGICRATGRASSSAVLDALRARPGATAAARGPQPPTAGRAADPRVGGLHRRRARADVSRGRAPHPPRLRRGRRAASWVPCTSPHATVSDHRAVVADLVP